MTGYEEKFYALGTPINRCEVICHPRPTGEIPDWLKEKVETPEQV